MSAVAPLDWRRLSLGEGRVLIEASAGTGKTWTIGTLFLRLLLERELPVEQILVVTFTDAAAQELRERLRMRLAQAEGWLQAILARQPLPDDPVAKWLCDDFAKADKANAGLRLIRLARMDFDRAPVATIHSICQRIQADFPLESGANFSAGRRLDEDALLRECLEDFWRRRYLAVETVDPDEADAVIGEGPEGLLNDLRGLLNHEAHVLATNGLEAIVQSIESLSSPESIAGLRNLADAKALYAPRKSALSKRLAEMADLLQAGTDIRDLLTSGKCEVLDAENIAEQLAAGTDIENYPLLCALQRLRGLTAQRKTFVRGNVLKAAYDYCRAEMPLRAARRQGQTFSMLIDSVRGRIDADDTRLANRLHEAFPAVLIDEFQDTDARQFEIFDRICRDRNGVERGLLALIGDPKQAIYGFRGGDIATYLDVRERIAQRFDLVENFRSSTPLIDACNALYGAAGEAFDDPRLRYVPVRAAGKADESPFTRGGTPVPQPFAIHRFTAVAGDNKAAKERAALADCSARIIELLDDEAVRIGDARVAAGDIAVLLPKNRHIGTLRELLLEKGVPCTGSGSDSVFEGETARELQLVLHAVLHPGDDRAARGALTTRLLGKRFADVEAWRNDAAAFERELDRIARWNALLRTRGTLGVVAAMLDDRAAELLSLPEGERIVADLRQLGELLGEREGAKSGTEGALAWLAAMRRDEKGMEVSSGYRLRSEPSGGVRLMTLHAAKGLQFPIVFLPLAWHIADRKGGQAPKALSFEKDGRTCVDLGSAQFEKHRHLHFESDLRERLRLLYVSITRAQYAVHLYWTEPKAEKGSPAWNVAAIDALLRQAQRKFGLAQDAQGLAALARKLEHVRLVAPCTNLDVSLARVAGKTARVVHPPLPAARPFFWSHSFSSITRHRVLDSLESAVSDEFEAPALPEVLPGAETAHPALRAMDAWRGKAFGVAVHGLLEAHRIEAPTVRDIDRRMRSLGVRARGDEVSASAALAAMLERVRESDLGDGLCLSRLRDDACVTEFGFQLPVTASVPVLRALCAEHGVADAWPERTSTPALNGLLNGFADLIFAHGGRYHVLDYKTNRLGECLSDYAAAALDAAMSAHHYPLQALLYTVALHRYLRRRLSGYSPERHLGDSIYLFLRGVGLAPDAGVWRRRWPAALIVALDEGFAAKEIAA